MTAHVPRVLPSNDVRFTLTEIAEITGGTIVRAGPPVRGIWSEARTIQPGGAFVPIDHGREAAIAEALLGGAAAFVLEPSAPRPPSRGLVIVPNGEEALLALARAHRERIAAQSSIVGITGSAGKTTTKRILAAVLEAHAPGAVVSTSSDATDDVGIALTLLSIGPRHRFGVFELATGARGDVGRRASIVTPDVGVVTLVGLAHAEGVGGPEEIQIEKGDLLAAVGKGGVAIVNGDDDGARACLSRAPASARRWTWGAGAEADYRVEHRESLGLSGTRLRIARPRGPSLEVLLPLLGDGAPSCATAAIAAAESALGAPVVPELVTRAFDRLGEARDPSFLATRLADDTILLEERAEATVPSLRAAVLAGHELAARMGRRLVVVLAGLEGLGKYGPSEHARLGQILARTSATTVIAVGPNVGPLVDATRRGVPDVAGVRDARSATLRLLARRRPGDVVVVAGATLHEIARTLVTVVTTDLPATGTAFAT
jgi:UDP-N-acetylmuramoyl-tripeptide--D-alanyl-D-alanine ligase